MWVLSSDGLQSLTGVPSAVQLLTGGPKSALPPPLGHTVTGFFRHSVKGTPHFSFSLGALSVPTAIALV